MTRFKRTSINLLAGAALLGAVASNAAESKRSAALEALLKKRAASKGESSPTGNAKAPENEPVAAAPAAEKPAESKPAAASAKMEKAAPGKDAPAKKEDAKPGGPRKLSFEDFDLVVKRNIFDPERRKAVVRGPAPPRPPPPPPSNRIVLKGTMKTHEKEFASFDSTLDNCRGSFKTNDKLGEFKLASITRTNATLMLETNTFTLAVGEGLSRTGDAPWKSAGAGSFSSGGKVFGLRSSPSSSGSNASAGSGSSGEKSSALQRLLEMRRKSKGN